MHTHIYIHTSVSTFTQIIKRFGEGIATTNGVGHMESSSSDLYPKRSASSNNLIFGSLTNLIV